MTKDRKFIVLGISVKEMQSGILCSFLSEMCTVDEILTRNYEASGEVERLSVSSWLRTPRAVVIAWR